VGGRCLVLGQHEPPGHTQVHDQDGIPSEARNDVLPSSLNGFEDPTPQTGGEIRRGLAKDVGVKDLEVLDRFSGELRAKAPDDGLDLR
jgi:hypothetical protein